MSAHPPTNKSGNTTARKAAQILVAKNIGYLIPTSRQKKNLVVAFAKRDMIVYGKAFDVVHLKGPVNLDSLEEVECNSTGFSSARSNQRIRNLGATSEATSLRSLQLRCSSPKA